MIFFIENQFFFFKSGQIYNLITFLVVTPRSIFCVRRELDVRYTLVVRGNRNKIYDTHFIFPTAKGSMNACMAIEYVDFPKNIFIQDFLFIHPMFVLLYNQ